MSEHTPAITPVRCPAKDCHWAAYGIPDQYTEARMWHLAAHRAEEHGKPLTAEQVAYGKAKGYRLPETQGEGPGHVPAPLTPERLAEIRARRAAVPDTPWGSYRDLDGRYTVQAGAYVTPAEGFASSGVVAHIAGDTDAQRHHRAEFIAYAPRDIDDLLAALEAAQARVAELEQIEANARKLVSGWLRASAEHFSISNLDAVKHRPLFAGIQDGRANQYSDCANELRDVLDGEDPDGWTFKVGINVAPAAEAGEQR